MPKRHPLDGIRNARRLCKIELVRLAVRDRAIRTRAGADVAENHEGRRPMVPALADVRTPRLLTDGVELQLLHYAFETQIVLRTRRAHLEPRRLGFARPNKLDGSFDHPYLV